MHDDDEDLEEEEDYDEDDGPDEADLDYSPNVETIPCPHCGEQVYEQAEQCPWCGQYLSREQSRRRIPWWIIVGALLAIASVLVWVL